MMNSILLGALRFGIGETTAATTRVIVGGLAVGGRHWPHRRCALHSESCQERCQNLPRHTRLHEPGHTQDLSVATPKPA
jgi:hypothetical protein